MLIRLLISTQSGSVWKEDNGCDNCICISGHAECVAQTCDFTTCEPGYALLEVEGECCPRCFKTNVTCSDESHEVSLLVLRYTPIFNGNN